MTLQKEARMRKRLQRAAWLRGKITVAKAAISKGVANEDNSKDDAKKEKWKAYRIRRTITNYYLTSDWPKK